MAFPDYADTGLPSDPLIDTWTDDPYLDNITTDMAGGNKRNRAFPGDDLARYTFDIRFTNAQYVTFRDWVKNTLGLGVSRFYMQVWDGSEKVNKLVQFAAKYKPQTQAPSNVIVSFDLWIYPS